MAIMDTTTSKKKYRINGEVVAAATLSLIAGTIISALVDRTIETLGYRWNTPDLIVGAVFAVVVGAFYARSEADSISEDQRRRGFHIISGVVVGALAVTLGVLVLVPAVFVGALLILIVLIFLIVGLGAIWGFLDGPTFD